MTLSKSIIRSFNKAQSAAGLSDYVKTQVGCVAIHQGRTIGVGYNTTKTHPAQKLFNLARGVSEEDTADGSIHHSIHAEIMCLNSICADIPPDKIKLFIYRRRRNTPHGLARPCPACMAAIRSRGIKHIYYTTDDGYATETIGEV